LDYMSSQEDKKIQFYHSAQIWLQEPISISRLLVDRHPAVC
jgi:hypothetical protein